MDFFRSSWRSGASWLMAGILGMAATSAIAGEYQPYVSVGGKFGDRRSIGETQFVLPFSQDPDRLIFTDLRFKADDDSAKEGNFGLAYRAMANDGLILTGYGFYDRRRTEADHTINQLTLGAEALTLDHDLRVNAYFPERKKHLVSSVNTASLTGTQLFIENTQTFEKGAPGADIEYGYRLPISAYDIRAYVGGYYFDLDDDEDMLGARARLRLETDTYHVGEQSVKARFSGEVMHDNVRGDTRFLGAELVIPLGASDSDKKTGRGDRALRARMMEPLVRDVDVVTHAKANAPTQEAAQTTLAGTAHTSVHVINPADETELTSAVSALPSDAVIYLAGGGSPITLTSSLTLQSSQALISGGNALSLYSASGKTAAFASSAPRANLVKGSGMAAGTALITLGSGSNNLFENIDFTNQSGLTGDANVMISNSGNAISGLTLNNVNSEGSVIVDITSGTTNVTVNQGEYYGLVLRTRNNSAMNIDVRDSTFKRTFTNSVVFSNVALTGMVNFESMGTSSMHVTNFSGNTLLDDRANAGGRFAGGLFLINNSTNPLTVTNLRNNSSSRTLGSWDTGAILSQAAGGSLVSITGMSGNSGIPFEVVNTSINIATTGYAASEAGLEAANPGLDYVNYGGNTITNTP